MRLAVVGSINTDMTVTAERIPLKGETLMGSSLSYIPGGKGANQAVAMAKLGAAVEMFGCVGDDSNGEKMLENLKAVGVGTEHIQILKGVPTGIAMITVGDNDNTIIVVPGANGKVDRAYIDSIKSELEKFDMVVLQHEIPLETVHYVIEFCYEKGIKIVLNPAPAAAVPMEIIDKVTYVTPNEHEPVGEVDYGFVGDVKEVNADLLASLIHQGIVPVLAPLTHDKQGHMLNTNADTIAGEAAKALAKHFEVTLMFCFEKKGVLKDENDDESVIPEIDRTAFEQYVEAGVLQGGMIPKLENSFQAIDAGVKQVIITQASDIHLGKGTRVF